MIISKTEYVEYTVYCKTQTQQLAEELLPH